MLSYIISNLYVRKMYIYVRKIYMLLKFKKLFQNFFYLILKKDYISSMLSF